MLRAFASQEGVYNVDELFLERQKALAAQTPTKAKSEVGFLENHATVWLVYAVWLRTSGHIRQPIIALLSVHPPQDRKGAGLHRESTHLTLLNKLQASHMHQVLGERPPKAARGDYTRFRELVGAALGGETPFEELNAATRAMWVAISRVPKGDPSSRLSAATLLKPYRQAL